MIQLFFAFSNWVARLWKGKQAPQFYYLNGNLYWNNGEGTPVPITSGKALALKPKKKPSKKPKRQRKGSQMSRLKAKPISLYDCLNILAEHGVQLIQDVNPEYFFWDFPGKTGQERIDAMEKLVDLGFKGRRVPEKDIIKVAQALSKPKKKRSRQS